MSEVNLTQKTQMITPEQAAALLSTSAGNRSIRKSMIDRYASDMIAGKWLLNGEPIIISKTGKLLEGHHRLLACIKSGAPFPASVTYGVDDSVFPTINTGGVRSPGDVFTIEGIPNSNKVSSLVTKALHYQYSIGKKTVNQWNVPFPLTKNTLLEIFREDERGYLDATNKTVRLYDANPSVIPSVAGAMHYLFATVDQAKADEFMEYLTTGAYMGANHPAMKLRNAWIKRGNSKRRSGSEEMMVITCHAWNAYVKGREIGILRHNSEHPVPNYK